MVKRCAKNIWLNSYERLCNIHEEKNKFVFILRVSLSSLISAFLSVWHLTFTDIKFGILSLLLLFRLFILAYAICMLGYTVSKIYKQGYCL